MSAETKKSSRSELSEPSAAWSPMKRLLHRGAEGERAGGLFSLEEKNRRSRILLFFVSALILASLTPEAQACPTCSDIVTRGKDALKFMQFGNGISWSIVLMLSIPYILIGSFVFIIWRGVKKKKEQKAEDVVQ